MEDQSGVPIDVDEGWEDAEWDVVNAASELELMLDPLRSGDIGASLAAGSNDHHAEEEPATDVDVMAAIDHHAKETAANEHGRPSLQESLKDIEIEDLKRENNKLAAIVEAMQMQMKSTSSNMASLQFTNSKLQETINQMNAHASSLEAERKVLEAKLSLSDRNAVHADELIAYQETIKELKNHISFLENDNRTLEKQTVKLENYVEETNSSSQSGVNCLCLIRDRMTVVAKEMDALQRFIADESSNIHVIDEDITHSHHAENLNSVMQDLNVAFAQFEESLAGVVNDAHKLKAAATSLPPVPISKNKLTLTKFVEGDLAMFFPTPRGDYLAFNIGSPHHYLSEESKALIGRDVHFKKVYVLGRIVMKEEKVAPAMLPPYNLAPGTVYYEVSVESIADVFPVDPVVAASRRVVAARKNNKPRPQEDI